MEMAPTDFLGLFLIISFLVVLFKQCQGVAKKLPPGPKKLPIIGHLHHLGRLPHHSLHNLSTKYGHHLGRLPHHSLHNLSTKYGHLMFLQLGSIPTLVISSADAAREVLQKHDVNFSGRPALYAAKKLSYGLLDITFAPYGEYWREARKICVIELLSMKRVQSFQAVRAEEADLLISSIRSISSSSMAPINLSEMLFSMVNNIVSRVVFGDKYRGGHFHQILEESESLLGGFCLADFFPWLEWIHKFTALEGRLEKNFSDLDGFYNRVIEDHLSQGWPEPGNEDLVHVLLRLHKDPISCATFSSINHIKGLLTDLFIAGTDTSSTTLVWAMTELIRKPRIMNKLQQELREVVGNKIKIDEDDLQHLDYLKLVIKEVLRLHPPSPLLVPRETTYTCKIQDYEIPVKTRVFINAKSIAMDPEIWRNPEEFYPERFLGNVINFRGQDFTMVHFGVGRRSCPGVNFARVIIELALANLLYYFNWGLPLGMEVEDLDFDEAFGLTTHKKNPLFLVAKSL